MIRRAVISAAVASLVSAPALAGAPDTEAVEFYNIHLNHYFVTATAAEAGIVEAGGAGDGWVRTGRSFPAWLSRAAAPADAQPVCRFYSAGANSHFYTASAAECEGLKASSSGWQYEGIGFYVQAPRNGQCDAGTVAMKRVYNDGFRNGEGSNHRFVDDDTLQALMTGSGWIAEGTVFCSAAKATGTNASRGISHAMFQTLAGTFGGNGKWEKETAQGETRTRAPLELTLTAEGALTGSGAGCTFTGEVTQADGFRSLFTGTATAAGCADAAFNGDYEARLERFGRVVLKVRLEREQGEDETGIEAVLVNRLEPPVGPPQRNVAGDWSGTVRWEAETADTRVTANRLLELTITPAGAITGTGYGCAFTGTVGGDITAAGCEVAGFNGTYASRLRTDGRGRLKVELEREGAGVEVEIEGVLISDSPGAGGPPEDDDDEEGPTSLAGRWSGPLEWTVGHGPGATTGTGTLALTITAEGAVTGTGAGCAFSGTVAGPIAATGCTLAAMSGNYTDIEVEREEGRLVVKMKREDGPRVKLKAKLAPAA